MKYIYKVGAAVEREVHAVAVMLKSLKKGQTRFLIKGQTTSHFAQYASFNLVKAASHSPSWIPVITALVPVYSPIS